MMGQQIGLLHSTVNLCVYVSKPGFTLPTGPAKPAGSGTGIPDRFGRKSVETGQI